MQVIKIVNPTNKKRLFKNLPFFLVQIHLSAEAAVKKREAEAKFCAEMAQNNVNRDNFMVSIIFSSRASKPINICWIRISFQPY